VYPTGMAVKPSDPGLRRNPGPRWGYALMAFGNRVVPGLLANQMVRLGAGIAMLAMPTQRRHSEAYLQDALGRRVTWRDRCRHFTAFARFLVRRFDAAEGREPEFCSMDSARERLSALLRTEAPALCGTFHFGNADLMGFWLSRFDVSVRMVRFRVANSTDLRWLGDRFGDKVRFIWVNETESLMFTLKDAVEAGHSIAMKCDRVEHSSKWEAFEFLGRRRWFPFTIYHLSILFGRPVIFTFGLPVSRERTEVFSSSVFRPGGASKRDALERARSHFREVLDLLEGLIERDPYQWFNFLDAVPAVESQQAAGRSERYG